MRAPSPSPLIVRAAVALAACAALMSCALAQGAGGMGPTAWLPIPRTAVQMWSTTTSTHQFGNQYAFAALKADGSVVTWGRSSDGGDSSAVSSALSGGVTQVFSTAYAFAALKADGSVVTWGDTSSGGDSSAVTSALSGGVTYVLSSCCAFAALKSDGSVVTWGDTSYGGDSSAVSSALSGGVTQVFSAAYAFAALKADGSVATWGNSSYGGDSSGVSSSLTSGVETIASPLLFPAYLPGAPTGVSAAQPAAGETGVVVSFAPPLSNGGTPVTSYRATCTSSTGGAPATATTDVAGARSMTVTGLTLGATYTCTVSAVNVVGTGSTSVPSAAFGTSAIPSPSNPATPTRVGSLPGHVTCAPAHGCTTAGVVPKGATRVVQIATGAHATARVTTTCTIRTKGSVRTYTCRTRLGAGKWTLTTQAKAGATVIAQSVKRVTVTRKKSLPVTG